MTRHISSLEPSYFESIFLGNKDPWNLDSSAYEQAKFAHTVEVLGQQTGVNGFEVGCARGALTSKLAPIFGSLFSIDVSGAALSAARKRCRPFPHVSFANMRFPEHAPEQSFGCVILSEVVYYWDDADIRKTAEWLKIHLQPGGTLLLVHWTGETDYPQSGDDAVNKLRAALGDHVEIDVGHRRAHYRLDLWRRVS